MNQGRQLRTFLFGDIEGSTRRWEADPDGMGEVVAGHDGIVNSAVEGHGGKGVQAHRRRFLRRL